MPEDQDQPEPEPVGLNGVMQNLPAIVEKISSAGLHAVPLPVGRHTRPEAVIISAEQFLALGEVFDDLISAPQIRHRLESAPADEEAELFTPDDLGTLIVGDGHGG